MYEEEIGTIAGHFSPINCLIYTPDGSGFATAAEEGNIKVIKFDEIYWEFEWRMGAYIDLLVLENLKLKKLFNKNNSSSESKIKLILFKFLFNILVY